MVTKRAVTGGRGLRLASAMINSLGELVVVSGPDGLPPMRPALFTALLPRHELRHLRAFDEAVHQNDPRLLVFVRKQIHLFIKRVQLSKGQGASLDVNGNVVPSSSAAAHTPLK
jgi:hypothetical protein